MEKAPLLFNRNKGFDPKKQTIDHENPCSLVLSRRPGEKIIIDVEGELIEVFVTGIETHGRTPTVKILFKASKRVKVDREEVYIRKIQGIK
jgi:sRNA-binding carbon storage regulator CsrA